MKSASEIIDAIGGTDRVAVALKLGKSAVSNWRKRNVIPPSRWPKVAELARRKKIVGLTVSVLEEWFAKKAPK